MRFPWEIEAATTPILLFLLLIMMLMPFISSDIIDERTRRNDQRD